MRLHDAHESKKKHKDQKKHKDDKHKDQTIKRTRRRQSDNGQIAGALQNENEELAELAEQRRKKMKEESALRRSQDKSLKAKELSDAQKASQEDLRAQEDEMKRKEEAATAAAALAQKEKAAHEAAAAARYSADKNLQGEQAIATATSQAPRVEQKKLNFEMFKYIVSGISSLFVLIGTGIHLLWTLLIVNPILFLRDFLKTPLMEKLSAYIALGLVIYVAAYGFKNGFGMPRVRIPSVRMPSFHLPHASLPTIKLPGLPQFKLPFHWPQLDYRANLMFRFINPYATAPIGYPRDQTSGGRCDGMQWMPNGSGQCVNTTKPSSVEWTLDASRLKLDDLPPKIVDSLKRNGGNMKIDIPYKMTGTKYMPSCRDAKFASGDSASHFFEDDDLSEFCVLKKFPRQTHEPNSRDAGDADLTNFTFPTKNE